MKKNVVRGLALLLVLLMCLSLIPLATAHAEEHVCAFEPTEVPAKCSVEGYVQMICPVCGNGGEIISLIEPTGNHVFESIESEEYLIEQSDDPCVKPTMYWKSCVNVIDDQGTVCAVSAEEAYNKAVENLYNELNQRKENGEKADWEKIIKDAIKAFDDQYKFSRGGMGHTWVDMEKQEATCTSDGWTAYRQCSACGAVEGYQVVPAKGHRWGEITRIQEPTCTEPGLEHHICEVCGLDETGEVPALGHSFGEFTVTKAATCTEDGERQHTCAVCGYVETEVIPCGHKFGEFEVIQEPKCHEEGVQERVCSVCGEKEQEAIPAAHRYGEFVVTMEPTCYSTGERRSTCELCGEQIVEWIDMVPHKYENGECVFCHEPEPEKPVEEVSLIDKTDSTSGETLIKEESENGEEAAAETKAAEGELFTMSDSQVFIGDTENGAAEGELFTMSDSAVFTGDSENGKLIYKANYEIVPDEVEGGTGPIGTKIKLIDAGFERPGYKFAGWNTAKDGSDTSYAVGDDFTFRQGEVTLYAQWLKALEVNFDPNGGKGSMDSLKGYEKEKEPLPECKFTRKDYKFAGWNTKADGTGTSYGDVDNPNGASYTFRLGETTLYAQWAEAITVSFDPNGGEGEMGSISGHNEEKYIPYLPDCTFTRNGYKFAGWNTKADGTGTSYGDINNTEKISYTFRKGETTLYAKWVDSLELTIDPYGGKPETPIIKEVGFGKSVPFPEGIEYPEDKNKFSGYEDKIENIKVTRFDDASGRYYEFTGWNMTKGGTKADDPGTHIEPGAEDVRVNQSVTVYAEWRKPVTIYYEPNGGSGHMEDEKTYFEGDVVILDENTYNRDGEMLAFVGWNTKKDGSGTAYEDGDIFIIEDNLTLYAQWADAVFVHFDGNGATDGYMENQTVPENVLTLLNKNTFKRDNYTFVGWNTDPNGYGASYDNGDLVLLDKSVVLYAQWEQSLLNVSFYDGETFIKSVQVPKGDVIELIDYDMSSSGKVLIGWSLVKGRDVATYTVGQGYTPTEDTTFYAVSGVAVKITFVINGDSSNTQIVARSTNTELKAFDDMGIDPPDATKYFKEWSDTKNTYKDRQLVSLTDDITLTAVWATAEKLAPNPPSQVRASKHLVNYGRDLLKGHSGELSGLSESMQYYTGQGNWQAFQSVPVQRGIARPHDFEIRYAEDTSAGTPPSKSVICPVYSFMSEASAPEDKSTLLEEIYSYDVSIYSVRPSGERRLVDSPNTDEGIALQDVLSIEDIYFLLPYPYGVTQNSNMLTLMHDGKPVEIEQLSEGILGKANDFSNPRFTLYVEDKLDGVVTLSNTIPKAGETITATVTGSNIVGKVLYRWLRDGIPFTEYSSSDSYSVTGEDLMHTLSCEVKSANNPPTPGGTIKSAATSQVRIYTYETTSTSTGISSTVGYFDGVTDDMEYSINEGISWRPVKEGGSLQGNKLYVSSAASYYFRYRGEQDDLYWDEGTIEAWYIVGYEISTSSTESGSGTVTFRNGTTTLSSSSRITDSSGNIIIQADGTNRWRVRVGASTNLNMIVKPSGSSSSSSSSSSGTTTNVTYAHVSLNGGSYSSFTGERTISVEPVNMNKIYTIVFNRSSSSPRTADMSHLGLWSTVCFVSLVGTVGILGNMRRRKKAEN